MSKKKICVIGAGPSGMSALYHFANNEDGKDMYLVCYEKQKQWGGQWNYTWRTGTDRYGEPCHNGMYRYLFTNGAKEFHEYPDYTFETHFGKATPSFPPRPVMRNYLEGRWTQKDKADLRCYIKFNTVVRNVRYNDNSDDFTVETFNLKKSKSSSKIFTHVICAVGIFNTPNVPWVEHIDKFEGRIIHSHDFRNALEFRGQSVLIVGASYSAEDIAIQCLKYGAKNIVCTWKNKPMDFNWPEGIEERPMVQKFKKHKAEFQDGSIEWFDSVVFCTGYLYSFPFMEDRLRLESNLSLYPDNLYKGTLWLGGGGQKVFYLGTQNQYYSFTMFDAQALWVFKYITGKITDEPKSESEMRDDIREWVLRCSKLKDAHEEIEFQKEFVADLIKYTSYPEDALKSAKLMHDWIHHRQANILTYKDQCHASNWTGTVAPKPKIPLFYAKDEYIKTFLDENE